MPDASPSLTAPDPRARNGHSHGVPIFLIALLIGVGGNLAGLALLRLKVEMPAPPSAQPPAVRFAKAADAGQAKVMSEAAAIFDPRLLYLPASRNNASRAAQQAKTPEPRVFSSDSGQAPPAPTEENFGLLASSGGQPSKSSDVLKPAQWNFLGTIGQAGDAVSELPKRGAQLRITPETAGVAANAVKVITWPAAMAPKAGSAHWKPATFLLFFGDSGLVGEPLPQVSSGVPAVDDDLRLKLRQWFGRNSLPPGYYTVEIGP